MTNKELTELYRGAIYCDLDEETTEELSRWECETIFFPVIDSMIKDGFNKAELEKFVSACYFEYFMSDRTCVEVINKYKLERSEHKHNIDRDSPMWQWYLVVKVMNMRKEE